PYAYVLLRSYFVVSPCESKKSIGTAIFTYLYQAIVRSCIEDPFCQRRLSCGLISIGLSQFHRSGASLPYCSST
ncbi:MAG: hypothetical protein AAFO03_11245, partial [Bacteroidota bacterium]